MKKKSLITFLIFDLALVIAAVAVFVDQSQVPEPLRPWLAKFQAAVSSLFTVAWRSTRQLLLLLSR